MLQEDFGWKYSNTNFEDWKGFAPSKGFDSNIIQNYFSVMRVKAKNCIKKVYGD